MANANTKANTAAATGANSKGRVDTPERVEQRKRTAKANASADIDFGEGLDAAEFVAASHPSMWERKVAGLVNAVLKGQNGAEANKYYRLGTSENSQWATSVVSNLKARGAVPANVSLASRRVPNEDGKTYGSQLYGAVISPTADNNGGDTASTGDNTE